MKKLRKLAATVMLLVALPAFAGDRNLLWQIGSPGHGNAGLALAPAGYAQFDRDAVFIVGQSNAKRDWPYVQPGPGDRWAGSRPHTFKILFGVSRETLTGDCRLIFVLLDTQTPEPPKLQIEVNGHAFTRLMPAGAGDDSLRGQPARGRPHHFEVKFSAAFLQPGNNEIAITIVAGSWMLYEAVGLETPASVASVPVVHAVSIQSIEAQPALLEKGGKRFQSLNLSVLAFGEPREISVNLDGAEISRVRLANGLQSIEVPALEVTKEKNSTITLVAGGKILASQAVTRTPVHLREVYILMHSHNDNGFTDLQPNIAKKQAQNVIRALELIRQTKNNPPGARFKWNLEVLLPAEDFDAIATPEQKQEFAQAIRAGDIGVDGMYANLLTGLCRPEELLEQFTFAKQLGRRCGVNVDSMMVSDVPGLTWGIVSAAAQNGIRYISDGPNYFDRIGWAQVTWEDKPFWWIGPDGQSKVLYWAPYYGYAYGHTVDRLTDAVLQDLKHLDAINYPYDIVQVRWSKGDNGSADERVMKQVKDWNAKYLCPKLIIATTSQMFHEFEKRYGDQLPTFRGDFTPYWEDGAGSSARETALNRCSQDRLTQAETIWVLRNPGKFPADDFAAAWKNAALYDEHTWGAWNSISDPDAPFVTNQWHYKQVYALDADRQSRELMVKALGATPDSQTANSVDVYNTASWPRTDLVTLPKTTVGDAVKDENGRLVPSQRLSTGELVFLARDVPPLGAKRFVISPGAAAAGGQAVIRGTTLATPQLTVKLDAHTGDIVSLRAQGIAAELADGSLNTYLYLPGGNVKNFQSNGPAKVSVKESGPLVVSLVAESDAPGCHHLSREVRLVDGLDRVEIRDWIDKKAVRTIEGVHLGFTFNVSNPVVHINSPGTIYEPEKDQLPGACKNWYSVERWVDISNPKFGVTWATADAPLMEMGGLTADLPRVQGDPNAYLKTNPPSAKIYSWVMNNHWETNYRADQAGPTRFDYALRPHRGYDSAAAWRFGVESTEPLIVAPASGPAPVSSLLALAPAGVVAAVVKPADNGKALIVRLFNPTGKKQTARLIWNRSPRQVWLSSASEEESWRKISNTVTVPKLGTVTLRVEP